MVSFDLTRPKETTIPVVVGASDFKITLRRLTRQETLEQMTARTFGDKVRFQEMRLLRVIGWTDINDGEGKPLPFNDDTFGAVTANEDFLIAILGAISKQEDVESEEYTQEAAKLRAAVRSQLSGKGDIKHPLVELVWHLQTNATLAERFCLPLEAILAMDSSVVALLMEAIDQIEKTAAAMAKDN